MIIPRRNLAYCHFECCCVLASRAKSQLRTFLVGCLLLFSASTSTHAADKRLFKAEAAELIGGASKMADGSASGNNLIALNAPGEGVKFTGLPAASKLAIRYASVTNGTISVT